MVESIVDNVIAKALQIQQIPAPTFDEKQRAKFIFQEFVDENLLDVENNIKAHLNVTNNNDYPKIIAVSKTFKIDKILPLIDYGHIDFGENKVQGQSQYALSKVND